MRRPGAGAVATGLWVFGAAALSATVVLAWLNGWLGWNTFVEAFVLMTVYLVVGVIGAVVASRRSHNLIGWLFLTIFVLLSVLAYAQEHAIYVLAVNPGALPGGVLAAWVSVWAWYPQIGIFFIFVPLLFPTGRPPSPRWWLVGWIGGLAVAAMTVHSALSEQLVGEAYAVPNPVGLPGVVAEEGVIDMVAAAAALLAVVGAFLSLLVRFRRASGTERQQLKFFVAGALALPVLLILETVLQLAGLELPSELGNLVFGLGISLLPLAAGLAILRHRLYDIDRIISRTVAYSLLTGLLAGVYVAGVMVLGHFLRALTGGTELAVAASTLAVAALFGPLRRWLQNAVDRRFNRARYDAERVTARFRNRLRHEVDLDELTVELRATVEGTVQPSAASLWLASSEEAS